MGSRNSIKQRAVAFKQSYGREIGAVVRWVLVATLAQALVVFLLAIADKQREFNDTLDAWVDQGGAATFSIGLLAAALAESVVRYGKASQPLYWTGLASMVLIFYVAVEHGDVLSGTGGQDGGVVPERVIFGAIALGAIATFLTHRAERSRDPTRPDDDSTPHNVQEEAQVSGAGR